MKKNFMLLLLCSLALVSCKKDDSVKNKLSSGGGKWKITHLERYIFAPPSSGIQGEYFCNDCGEYQFNRNKTGEMVIGNSASSFTYSIADDGNKLVLYDKDGNGMAYNIAWNWNRSEFTITTDLSISGYSELITCKKN